MTGADHTSSPPQFHGPGSTHHGRTLVLLDPGSTSHGGSWSNHLVPRSRAHQPQAGLGLKVTVAEHTSSPSHFHGPGPTNLGRALALLGPGSTSHGGSWSNHLVPRSRAHQPQAGLGLKVTVAEHTSSPSHFHGPGPTNLGRALALLGPGSTPSGSWPNLLMCHAVGSRATQPKLSGRTDHT